MARKRPNIYPVTLKNGERRYRVMLSFKDTSGERHQQMLTFKTEKEARQALAEHEARRGKGQESPERKATFAACAAAWAQAHGGRVRAGTMATYQGTLRLHILPYLGALPTARITLGRLETHYRELAQRGVGPGLVYNVHQLCRQILRWAALHDYTVDAGALQTPAPRYQSREMTCWNDEEMACFAAVCDQSDYGPIWRVALYTGMRRGELMGLRWRDIDWDGGEIRVVESRSVVGSQIVTGPTKNGKVRSISVPETLLERLRRHRAHQLQERLRWGSAWVDPELVFTNYRGGTIQPASLRYNLGLLLERAGLAPIRIHDLRHTNASWLFRQGKTVSEVSYRLGHADASQTLNVYSHLIPSQHKETAEQLAAMFG
jgi:integrase